jgi:sigma-B regulation protein RsbU (phosphoserine phosphatase)
MQLIPEDEPARLEAIRRYDVLDTPHDGAFDRITALAARHFDVPISIVSIVDEDRIWFKSHHGLDVREIDREPGLCASAILHEGPWVVENAEVDPRTLANPLVAGEFGLRFYAGVPLRTHDGFNLGTLCVIDTEPRELTPTQTETLGDMAAIVMDELELRLASRRVIHQEQTLRDQAEQMARSLQESLLPPTLPEIPGAEVATLYLPAFAGEVGGDFYDAFEIGADAHALVIGDVSGKGAEAAAVTALARHTIRTAFLSASEPADVLATLNRAMFLGLRGSAPKHYCTVLIATLRAAGSGFELTLATAGHPPPLLLRDRTAAELDSPGGPPVGWHADAEFATTTAHLDGGDAVVLYTDGLSEARSGGALLGVEGIGAALAGGHGDGAGALAERLDAALRADGVEVRDDAAALVLKVDASRGPA